MHIKLIADRWPKQAHKSHSKANRQSKTKSRNNRYLLNSQVPANDLKEVHQPTNLSGNVLITSSTPKERPDLPIVPEHNKDHVATEELDSDSSDSESETKEFQNRCCQCTYVEPPCVEVYRTITMKTPPRKVKVEYQVEGEEEVTEKERIYRKEMEEIAKIDQKIVDMVTVMRLESVCQRIREGMEKGGQERIQLIQFNNMLQSKTNDGSPTNSGSVDNLIESLSATIGQSSDRLQRGNSNECSSTADKGTSCHMGSQVMVMRNARIQCDMDRHDKKIARQLLAQMTEGSEDDETDGRPDMGHRTVTFASDI